MTSRASRPPFGDNRATDEWGADPWDHSPPRNRYGAPGRDDRYVQRPPSQTPLTERVLSSTEDPGRTRVARRRVIRKTGMVAQNIPQAGRIRRVMRNTAWTGPRQYATPLGPRPVLDRRPPDGFQPWPTGTRLDTTLRAAIMPADRSSEEDAR